MKIGEISVRDVWAGTNWRFCPPDDDDWVHLAMSEWEGVVLCHEFSEQDDVIYSGLAVSPSGRVTPLLLLKTVGSADYGGDYCEYVNGRWRQVGLEPNPGAPVEHEYVADPLLIDPSFGAPDSDYRQSHREGFRRHAQVRFAND